MAGGQNERLELGGEIRIYQRRDARQALALQYDRLELELYMVVLPNRR